MYNKERSLTDIEKLRQYYEEDKVFITQHAFLRMKQRNIALHDIRHAVINGKIIKEYPNDKPFPSCLIAGQVSDGESLHIVMSDNGTSANIITTYIPDSDLWNEDLTKKKNKEQK